MIWQRFHDCSRKAGVAQGKERDDGEAIRRGGTKSRRGPTSLRNLLNNIGTEQR